MCLKELAKSVFNLVEPQTLVTLPEPKAYQEATAGEMFAFLVNKFPGVTINISRDKYRLPEGDDIRLFLDTDLTNKYGYDLDRYRCSDFATRLHGQFKVPGWADVSFGKVWTNVHALNCMVSRDWKFYFVEPQTDKLQFGADGLEAWQGNKIRSIEV